MPWLSAAQSIALLVEAFTVIDVFPALSILYCKKPGLTIISCLGGLVSYLAPFTIYWCVNS